MNWKRALLFVLLVPCWVVAWKFGHDLPAYYKVAQWLAGDQYELIFAPDGKLRWWYYSPAALIAFEPMGWFSFHTVKIIAIVLHTVGYIAFWLGLENLFPKLKETSFRLGWIVVFVMAINPLHTNFQSQNISVFLGAGLVWAEILSRTPQRLKQFLGGTLLVFVACFKLFPFFIGLFYLFTRSRSVKWGMLFGLVAVFFAPFLYFGFDTASGFYRDWIGNLTVYHQIYSLKINPENLSLPSLLSRWLGEVFLPAQVSLISKSIVVFLGILFFTFVYWSRRIHQSIHLWAFAMAMMALLNSSTRPDYFVFFVPAFASIVSLLSDGKRSWVYYLGTGLAVFLMAFTTEWVLGSKELNNLVESWRVPCVGMIFLCLVSYALVRAEKNMGAIQSRHG